MGLFESPAVAEATSTEAAVESTDPEAPPTGEEGSPAASVPEVDAAAKAAEAKQREESQQNAKIAKRFEAAKQAEVKVRQRELAIKQREAELEARQKELDERDKSFDAEPLTFLQKRGKDPEAWLTDAFKGLTPEEKRIRQLEMRTEAAEKLAREAQEKVKSEFQSREELAHYQAIAAVVNPEDHPHTFAMIRPEEFVSRWKAALKDDVPAFIEEYGRKPTREEMYAHIERQAEQEFDEKYGHLPPKLIEKILSRRQQAAGDATKPESGKDAGASESENGSGHPGADGPRTLINDHAATAASTKPQRSFDRAKAREELAERLEAEAAAARR